MNHDLDMDEVIRRRRETDRLLAASHVLRELGEHQRGFSVIQVTKEGPDIVDVLLDSGKSVRITGFLACSILEPVGFDD